MQAIQTTHSARPARRVNIHRTAVNLVAFRRFLLALTVAADNYAAARADAFDWLMDHCASWN